MRKGFRFKRVHALRPRGSVFVVIMVAVVLTILGGSALMMSNSYTRQNTAEALRYSAQVACRAIAEQAALMIHNGSCDLLIDEAVGRPQEILSAEKAAADPDLRPIYNLVLENASRISGTSQALQLRPRVRVVASVVDDNRRLNRSALNQFKEIYDEIQSLSDPDIRSEAVTFWDRMKNKDGRLATEIASGQARDETREAIGGVTGSDSFDKWVNGLSLASFKARFKEIKDSSGNGTGTYERESMRPLEQVFELFGTISSPGGGDFVSGKKPSPEQFRSVWEDALTGPGGPGQDAAKKVASCGSNPASALAHLLGDLKENKVVASATEVNVTNDFLYSQRYGDSKTYLIQLEATCPYELAGGRMKSSDEGVRYTTYRLFQKAPWEEAVLGASQSLVNDLVQGSGHANFTPQEISRIWPPEAADANGNATGRRQLVPTSTTEYYDPTKVMLEPLKGILPASVGSRLYPYTLCASRDKPMRLRD